MKNGIIRKMRIFLPQFKSKKEQSILFFLVVFVYMIWLRNIGSMTSISGDAADCWHSITTWYSAERYGSYTLYKGGAAVYPYVWLYRLAVTLHINEYFFCMLYHACLFAFVTTIGLPLIAEQLTEWKPVLWQRIAVPVFFFAIWRPTQALSELMVDLPSCSFFVMAACCILTLPEIHGKRRLVWVALSGLLTSICANISGQYSISALFLLILAVIQIWKTKNAQDNGIKLQVLQIIILFGAAIAVKLLNIFFMEKTVASMVAAGAWIPSGDAWLQRGLLYFVDKNRYLYGSTLLNPRGLAILQDICGTKEAAQTLIESAGAGLASWSILDYLKMALHYPVDAVVQALDIFFLSFSIDMTRQSVTFLLTGYSLFYIAVWNAVQRIHCWRDIISVKTLVVLSALCSLIPSMVMTLESRVAIGAQGVVLGTALLCSSIPQTLKSAAYRLTRSQLGQQQMSVSVSVYLVWIIFVLFCMMHIGTLYAQSDIGTEMLFKWW